MKSLLTVTARAKSIDLTTLAAVRLNLDLVGKESDQKIKGWITQASASIARECNRVLAKETISEVFRTSLANTNPNSDALMLARYPVISIASITADDVLLGPDEYQFDGESGIVSRLSEDRLACWNAEKIVVVYDAGFDLETEIPPELERACLSVVKDLLLSAKRDPFAKRIEIPDVRTVDYWVGTPGANAAIPDDAMALLNSFRVMRIG